MSSFLLRILILGFALMQTTSATTLFFKINGVNGESTHTDYPAWIEAKSLEFSGSIFQGAAGSFGLVKAFERSSPPLLKALEQGRFIPNMTIAFLKATPSNPSGEPVEFARLLFRDLRLTSCRHISGQSPSGDTEVRENYQFSFRAVFYRYNSLSSDPEIAYTDLDQGVDSDNDGMTDNFEDFFNLDKNSDDSALDSDGDGLTHLEEFRLGLNPRLASSAFIPLGDRDPENPQNFRLTWTTKPSKSYDIYLTQDLEQEPVFIRRVTASELGTSTSFLRTQSRGFFSIREVIE